MEQLKKKIPNLLTTIRLICCLGLIFSKVNSILFRSIYLMAGISDMFDGFLARRFHAESKFGERYDSIADLTLTIICCVRILPLLVLPSWCYLVIGVIIIIKLGNLIYGYRTMHTVFLHTIPNKCTGGLLFLLPLFVETRFFITVVFTVCVIALLAALHESYKLRSKRSFPV